MKSCHAPALSCPLCQMQVLRAPRNYGDRLVGLLWPVLRYRCASAVCGWEGLLRRPRAVERVSTYRGRQVLEAPSADCSTVNRGRQHWS